MFDLQHPFADYLALLAALAGRLDAAARLAGYADAVNARAVHLARAALGDAAFDRLHAEGAVLRDADEEALAFGEGAAP